jgi:hypothetical protein
MLDGLAASRRGMVRGQGGRLQVLGHLAPFDSAAGAASRFKMRFMCVNALRLFCAREMSFSEKLAS